MDSKIVSTEVIFLDTQRDLPSGVVIHDLTKGIINEIHSQKLTLVKPIKKSLAFFPWRKIAVVLPDEETFFRLRTSRNRNLITASQQKRYRRLKVGIVGMSVGSNILDALVITGGPKVINIADDDVIEIANLNRLHAAIWQVGKSKAEVAGQRALEQDPYLNIRIWKKRICADNIQEFIGDDKNGLDLVIDEIDSLQVKALIRKYCKSVGVPVLMATDNGDGVILDVERYDDDSQTKLFHGRVTEQEITSVPAASKEWIRLALKIVDSDLLENGVKKSIAQIGKTLSGIPQLGSTAALAGAAVAYATRNIALGIPMKSGKYTFGLGELTYHAQ